MKNKSSILYLMQSTLAIMKPKLLGFLFIYLQGSLILMLISPLKSQLDGIADHNITFTAHIINTLFLAIFIMLAAMSHIAASNIYLIAIKSYSFLEQLKFLGRNFFKAFVLRIWFSVGALILSISILFVISDPSDFLSKKMFFIILCIMKLLLSILLIADIEAMLYNSSIPRAITDSLRFVKHQFHHFMMMITLVVCSDITAYAFITLLSYIPFIGSTLSFIVYFALYIFMLIFSALFYMDRRL